MTVDRPSPFTLADALSFGGVSALMTALGVYAVASVGTAGLPVFLPALLGWGIYAWLVSLRKKLIDSYPHMTSHGIMVDLGAAKSKWSMSDIEAEVDRAVGMTADALGKSSGNMRAVLEEKHVWLRIMPGPIQHPQDRKVKVAGFVTQGGQCMRVGIEKSMTSIDKSALAHEVGHVLLGRCWGDWDQVKHHAFMVEHGLYRKS